MRKLSIQKEKKGAIGIIIFFFILMGVLVLGFIGSMVWAVVDIASDEITPVMEGLGMVGDANVSQAAEFSFGVVDTFVQAVPWLLALSYVLALVFTLVFVFIGGYNPHPAFIAFYISLMLLLVFGCVIMSNMYQDIYTSDDDIGSRLQEQTVMSYMILHSPFIMAIIAIIGGILMFGMQSVNKEGYGGGI